MTATDGTDETPTVQQADGEASVHVDDPLELLSAQQIARALGVDESSVTTLELSGEIFAIRRVGAANKQGYPAFQAWPGVAGAPLCLTLKATALWESRRPSSTSSGARSAKRSVGEVKKP